MLSNALLAHAACIHIDKGSHLSLEVLGSEQLNSTDTLTHLQVPLYMQRLSKILPSPEKKYGTFVCSIRLCREVS